MNKTNQKSDALINIIGDGSIGHLFTGYLLKSGQAVSLYSRTAKPSRKVTLTSLNSNLNFDFVTHSQSIDQFNSERPTIVAVKAHQLESIYSHIASLSRLPECLILMMNGMGLIELCQNWLPQVAVFQAATTQAARLNYDSETQQTIIEHTGYGETLVGYFDEPNPNPNTYSNSKTSTDSSFTKQQPFDKQSIDTVIKNLNAAIGPVAWSDNHYNNLWIKLLINSIINPLTAINNVNNGALIEHHKLNLAVKALTKELSPLLQHIQPVLTWRELQEKVLAVAAATAKNSSSMRQDILFGRKTEIDFITGYILKKAQRFGCSLPRHQQLYQQVKRLEDQTRTSVTK